MSDMTIEVMLAMTGLQRKVEELTTEMAKATLVINQQQDDIEQLQDIVELQAKLNVQNQGSITMLVTAVERLEKLQKEQNPLMWPGLGQ